MGTQHQVMLYFGQGPGGFWQKGSQQRAGLQEMQLLFFRNTHVTSQFLLVFSNFRQKLKYLARVGPVCLQRAQHHTQPASLPFLKLSFLVLEDCCSLCLSLLELPLQNSIDGRLKQKCIFSVLEAGNPRSRVRV